MHTDLSPHLHTPECNELIDAFKNCLQDNTFSKFMGACSSKDYAVIRCLKKERIARSAANRAKAREKQELLKQRVADPLAEYYFQPEHQNICGLDIKPITEEYVEDYPSIVDRFFTRYYYIKKGADQSPYQVLFHSNRICLICLAPEHPALTQGITSINFDIGQTDRSKNTVKGKAKKGGMILQHDSTLALLTTKTGEVYKVPSCVRSKLVEVHTEIADNPDYLLSAEEGAGYFAIVLPKPEHCDEIKASLMTQQQYDEYRKNLNKGDGQDEHTK